MGQKLVKITPAQARVVNAECERIRDEVRNAFMNSTFVVDDGFLLSGEEFSDEGSAIDQAIFLIEFAARMETLANVQRKAYPTFLNDAIRNELKADEPVLVAIDPTDTTCFTA